MKLDGYAKYMIQKYSLAVALAVIKSKPTNIDIKKHLHNIKDKINKSTMDSYEICEEDFQFNDSECVIHDINNESNDSVTILKDFDFKNLDLLDNENIKNVSDSFLNVFEVTNDIVWDSNNMNTTFLPESQSSQNTFFNLNNSDLTFCESPNKIDFNDKIKENTHKDMSNNYSEQTELYTLPDINTHISQSQDNLIVSRNFIAKIKNTNEEILSSTEKKDIFTIVNNTECLNTIEANKERNTGNHTIFLDCAQEIENKRNGSEEIISEAKRMKINKGDKKNVVLQKNQDKHLLDTELSKKISQNLSSSDEFGYFSTKSSHSNVKFDRIETNNRNIYEINEIISNIHETECFSNDSNSEDLTESQAEIVTFKVLEELSKIKNYIRRENKHIDTDSGYKSSQTRGSFKNALTGTSWNEPAQCLLNFLNSCPLVVSVMNITEEISKVLGKLIDRLHEEEKYPKFLDKILENVEDLINNVYNCSSSDDDSILKIDEKIHRIFLLNRSPHIIKFSIGKITNILENILPELQNIMEITHTEETENLCHILHILEILLKRYNSFEKFLSQVNSQETLSQETVLKKSSLTEIWRKKWNLSKGEVFEVQSLEKKCIMTKCGEVLNKITIEAMECYSLVSFSALQCYNILQK